MNKFGLTVLLVLAVSAAWSSFFIVDETELAIVTRFGEYRRTADKPGAYFKVPFIQEVRLMPSRILSSDTRPDTYLTLDKKRLVADPISRWRIVDPLQFYQKVRTEEAARARLDDIVGSELRKELATHNFGDIIGNARDPMMQKLADAVRKQVREFGIELVDVRIKRADLPEEVQDSVFQRMRAERERVAKMYRSEGEEEAAKIRADTDKEKTILLAQSYETAQKLRGEGDAEGTRIYAESFGSDPEFYDFSRSLEAYEKSMLNQSTLVLSTDSDLFRYFSKPGKPGR
jgi:membrane protease subunit HflC